jgi:HD-like signal output (HDOD) protein
MIFIRELDHRATELSKILFDQIFEIVTRQDCLILQDADISPRIDDFRVYVPQSSVTKKICSVMKETRWAYNLSVVDAIDFHHLSGFRTQKEHQAVLLLLFIRPLSLCTGHDREARQNDESSKKYVAE